MTPWQVNSAPSEAKGVKRVFRRVSFKEDAEHTVQISLPCGQCVGCRLERSRQWAIRCMHEASLYKKNCFITLTYNNDFVPKDGSLNYDHFQAFMKRFRKNYQGNDLVVRYDKDGNPYDTYPIRFYMAGEYGENFGRPHFHACIFNFDFDDKKYLKKTETGSILYESQKLQDLWTDPDTGKPIGFVSVGEVNFESAAYVARYIMKKVSKKLIPDDYGNLIDVSWHHYLKVDSETGELIVVKPEFNKMSLKPGIGQDWLDKYMSDVYPHDHVIVRGKKCKPPRFYDNKYKKLFPFEFDELQFARETEGRSRYLDNTPERLAVKEQCAQARLSRLKRTI